MSKPTPDMIVLIHGFAASRLVMAPLRLRLQRSGFRVTPWSYWSLMVSVQQHGANLNDFLKSSLGQESRIHIVAHSMGSIVARAALASGPTENMGRAVFLAPPNRGTPVARHAAKLLGRVCPPIADLSDAKDSFVNSLADSVPLELGVIAARFDLLVPVANTHLPYQRDHIVLNATHNSLLLSNTAAKLAASFIAHGQFQ